VGSLTNWSKVRVFNFAIATKTDGTLWSWGYNFTGQLGLGDTTDRSSPTQVGSLTNWADFAILFAGTCLAVKTDGTLWGWGTNTYGVIGLGNETDYSSPKQVGVLTNWSKLAGGNRFSMAIKTDGTIWSWGQNSAGQLGLGNRTYYSSPKQVGALTNWSSISCGSNFAAPVKTDGTLWSWGQNNHGQLGLGNRTYYSSPKQVGSLTNWLYVACATENTLGILKI
jgi:alpha-tubulin suppressor-like RCC1 family protein